MVDGIPVYLEPGQNASGHLDDLIRRLQNRVNQIEEINTESWEPVPGPSGLQRQLEEATICLSSDSDSDFWDRETRKFPTPQRRPSPDPINQFPIEVSASDESLQNSGKVSSEEDSDDAEIARLLDLSSLTRKRTKREIQREEREGRIREMKLDREERRENIRSLEKFHFQESNPKPKPMRAPEKPFRFATGIGCERKKFFRVGCNSRNWSSQRTKKNKIRMGKFNF